MKKSAGVLLICWLLCGCNAQKAETIQEEALKAVQAHPEIIKEHVLQAIRENPQIVMDVLKERNIEVLQLVQKAGVELAEKKTG